VKWSPQDVDVYLQSKEYIDTAVLPLLPVTFDGEMKQAAEMTEFISLLTGLLERQFKGRLMLLPGFSYLKTKETEKVIEDLKFWEDQLLTTGFNHVFYITSDSSWNSRQDQLTGSVIWMPSIPMEAMQESAKVAVIESQVKQMINLFTQKWNK
jgi:hypothetical protein